MRCLWGLLALAFASAAHAGPLAQSIDGFIASEAPRTGAPGVAYAVVEDGAIASGAYGETLISGGRAVTPETPFLLGSISKSFTAMAVMQLVEAGAVDLDAPIADYLDTFAGHASGAVTVRQLLSHTSGFSTRQGNAIPDSDAIARIAQWTLAQAPGARWQYSNANYVILGALIEAVSGEEYAHYIETRILQPIGMHDSFVAGDQRHATIAVGHRPWFGMRRPIRDASRNRVSAPAGGIVSTASDMALYLATMMNGQDDVISAESKALMLRPASAVSRHYGFGWGVDPANDAAYHSGLTPGVETLAVLSPAQGRAAVVLVNANGGIGFGEISSLFDGVSGRVRGVDVESGDSGGSRKLLFLTFAVLPLIFIAATVAAWFLRAGLRAKSGLSGAFSLWFPLLTTLALAWTALTLIPQLFGVSLETFSRYQPDFSLLLVATAATGVVWAVFRLAVFYSGRRVGNRGLS